MNEDDFAKLDLSLLFPKVNYAEYIKSDAWRELSNKAKRKAGMKCNRCGAKGQLNTLHGHHKTYQRLGHEFISDIEALCADCHKKETDNPTPYTEPDWGAF